MLYQTTGKDHTGFCCENLISYKGLIREETTRFCLALTLMVTRVIVVSPVILSPPQTPRGAGAFGPADKFWSSGLACCYHSAANETNCQDLLH